VDGHPFPMQVFEAPKRDKHGKIINEEDAEARSAARELRRQRDEARQAAEREKRLEEQEKQAQAALALASAEEKPAKKRRKKKKPAPQPESVAKPAVPEPSFVQPKEPTADSSYGRLSRWPKLTRSGTLMDTGDAMPNTEFHRPNPLDSDVIMDATARLLAPRRAPSVPSYTPFAPKEESPAPARKGKKKKSKAEAKPEPVPVTPKQEAKPEPAPAKKKKKKRKKAAPAAPAVPSATENPVKETPKAVPAPKQERTAPDLPGKKRKKRRAGHSSGTPEPRRQHKDSTEQPSLMKPYYLDFNN